MAKNSVIVELGGTEEKIEAFIELMKPYGITELARTGVIAIAPGMQIGRENNSSDFSKARKRSLDAPATAALPPS